jgi:hypothetical protein
MGCFPRLESPMPVADDVRRLSEESPVPSSQFPARRKLGLDGDADSDPDTDEMAGDNGRRALRLYMPVRPGRLRAWI